MILTLLMRQSTDLLKICLHVRMISMPWLFLECRLPSIINSTFTWYTQGIIIFCIVQTDFHAFVAYGWFFAGSILAVSVADLHAPTRQNRFVGICILRAGHGLRANFTLRNIVDGQGEFVLFLRFHIICVPQSSVIYLPTIYEFSRFSVC
jgi:Ribosomal protein L19